MMLNVADAILAPHTFRITPGRLTDVRPVGLLRPSFAGIVRRDGLVVSDHWTSIRTRHALQLL
jgi:hypothetical protein